MDDLTEFKLAYSLFFGGIFALTLLGVLNFSIIHPMLPIGVLAIWVGGLAIIFLYENHKMTLQTGSN